MQKRPKDLYRLEYNPISLPDDFAISSGAGIHRQSDTPITRLHLHDCLELGYCYSGSGIFVIEDKVFPFRGGDVSVINDQEMHLAQSAKGTVSEWTFIMIDPARLLGPHVEEPELLSIGPISGRDFRNILPGTEHTHLARLARELIQEIREKKPGYRSAVRALVWAIMVGLHRLPGVERAKPAAPRRREMKRVAPALDYLTRHHVEPVRIADLAKLCHVSVTHFRRLFRQAVGQSPGQYLARLRIRMAAALLESSGRKILDISLEVGYPTLSSFNRHFRAIMGMSPREWRRRLS
jgi:AraC-like DNA-binding protein